MPPKGKKKHKASHPRPAAARNGRHGPEAGSRYSTGASTPSSGGHHGFTLQDEARNTERHHSNWDSDRRLRYANVSFVRGGSLDPTIPVESPAEVDKTTSSLADMAIESAGEELVVEVFQDQSTLDADAHQKPHQNHDLFFVDTQAEPLSTGLPPPCISSPTPSDSSAEIILFGGRDRFGRAISRPRQAPKIISDPLDAKIQEVEKAIHVKEEMLQEVLQQKATEATSKSVGGTITRSYPVVEVKIEPEKLPRRRNAKAPQESRRKYISKKQREEEALMADYIANMDDEDSFLHSFGRRELGGTDDELWQDETDASSVAAKQNGRMGWGRDEINDFDDLSTSDGVMGDVKDILSKRDRVSGLQYLVVWEDQAVDEARWVPVTTLTSVNAQLHIEKFEAEEKLVAEFLDNSESDDSSSDELEEGDGDDVESPSPKASSRMSDEQIARLLAKQEELGLGADELLLFDGDGDDQDQEELFSTLALASSLGRRQAGKDKGKNARRPKGELPSATLMADAYDGFDVMDFDRPSLRKRPKGRKGTLVFDLSDSELEASMINAWENDRVKKKERKQEREELRAQGLLGSKYGKPNLSAKYMEGMGLHQIKQEFKLFLEGDHTTLSLPPMEKAERKSIHELANAFNLKSKSAGSGKTRFPVLYKTQRAKPFYDHTFDTIASRISRRFLPRPDVKHRAVDGGRDRGGGVGAASYRDGDVVGASAPELGVENRGRAMLEKMGWSSGTALGALNNKGILQPVSHVVKTSKAGLG